MSQQREELLRYLVTTIWDQYGKPGFSMVIEYGQDVAELSVAAASLMGCKAVQLRTTDPTVRISIDAERLLVPAPCDCCGAEMLVRLTCPSCECWGLGRMPDATIGDDE